jgi:AGZA family xanthine/uracil permease-like MFS transporter
MTAGMSTVIFTLLFIDFFDTAGTLTSVANVAGKVDKQGKVQDINKAMLSDSVGTVAGAMMGQPLLLVMLSLVQESKQEEKPV